MHPLRCGQAHRHAGDDGDKGLHIVIDAHGGGQQPSLGIHHEQEGEEGCSGHDIDQFGGGACAHGAPVNLDDVGQGERQNHHAGKGEGPFVKGEGVILAEQACIVCQVEGVTHLGGQDEQVAAKVRRLACGARRGARDQQHRACETQHDAQQPPWRDALMQKDAREYKRENGHRR